MQRVECQEVHYKSKGICVLHDSSVNVIGMVSCEFEVAMNEGWLT